MRWRIFQIRVFSAFLTSVGSRVLGCRLILRLRSWSWSRSLIELALGYRRDFTSFAEAQASATRYIRAGHEHPDEIRYHAAISDTVRESDYPVLFHLAPLAGCIRQVFDLGGHVGNLFYAYQSKICFGPNLIWKIYDLPSKKPLGEELAARRDETRIRFVSNLADASGSDVFIASGSLHYFEEGLCEILSALENQPAHVFVNRTPCSLGQDLITVQDNRSYLVPCKLHSRAALISGMEALGYALISEWPVHERRLWIPMHPDLSARTYSGFYFRKKWIDGPS